MFFDTHLLRVNEQMSMAVGLEIRVPFLDHNPVEEALVLTQQYETASDLLGLAEPLHQKSQFDRRNIIGRVFGTGLSLDIG